MTDAPLLARYAESLFWMARYLERIENLARLIDVTQSFSAPGASSWMALVRINADEDAFVKKYGTADGNAVARFYLWDQDNPSGVPTAILNARTNARTLRPVISTEMWQQLNILARELGQITEADLSGDRLSRLCERIKLGIQEHTGITEGTFFRDQGWFHYHLGRLIERADQTTRLVDIQYDLLMAMERPGDGTAPEERRVAEMTQWGGLLRAAAGYHAFRRVSPPGFTGADVVAFLLMDGAFPRSVKLCVSQMEWALTQLRSRYGLRGTVAALERVEEVRAALSQPVDGIIESGLHQFLDGLQRDLILLANDIGTAFFRDWRPHAPEVLAQAAETQAADGPGTPGMTQTMGGMTQTLRGG